MKKIITLLAAVFLAIGAMAAETEVGLNDYKDFSHWSISVNGGLSQFDGDATQDYNQLLSNSRLSWTVGIDVEYTFNPYWGIIAQFQYLPYQGRTNSAEYGSNDFVGSMYDPSLQASINLFNLFGQYRKTWKWALYLNAGVGMTFYNVTHTSVREGGQAATDIEDGRAINFPLYMNLEYNINKYLAVGLLAGYRFHNKDNFEGEHYTRGTYNDGAFSAQLDLRVKLAPNKRQGGHMRNISPFEYRKLKVGENQLQSQIDSLNERLTALEDTVYNSIAPKVEELTTVQPDGDGDGVPDIRDREPNTPKGSFVNYWGESIQPDPCCNEIKQMLSDANFGVDYNQSVYFAIDEAKLSREAKANIAQVAQKMKDNPELLLDIRGYCDYPGSGDYNMKLSQKRVELVGKELIEKHGIAAERITMTPKGQMSEPPSFTRKNRRCDFYFYK